MYECLQAGEDRADWGRSDAEQTETEVARPVLVVPVRCPLHDRYDDCEVS